MEQPQGTVSKGNESKVCLLQKSLYGLRQASREWYNLINQILLTLGFKRSVLQACVYFKISNNSILIIALFVDDFLVLWNKNEQLEQLKRDLKGKFDLVDLGPVQQFLGIQIKHDSAKGTLSLNQKPYILDLLKKYNMKDCNPICTPLEVRPSKVIPTEELQVAKDVPYQNLIGGLMYLVVCTRPDIAYAVSYLSQYNKKPTQNHWKSAKRVLRYLKYTIDKCIIYKFKPGIPKLLAYSDADYANDVIDRKSYGGYVFFMAGGPISWESKKMATVCQSSCESEYLALNSAAKMACFLQNFYNELFQNLKCEIILNSKLETTVFTDSQSAKTLAENPIFHPKTKHIEVKYHFIREKVLEGKFILKHVSTTDMIADVLTKALPKPSHKKHTDMMLH